MRRKRPSCWFTYFATTMEKLSPKEAGLERIRDLDVLSTIPEMLALQVEKRPDAVGWKSWDPVKKSWRDWTFRQGYDEVQRWRHAFAGLGLTRGTRVAMLLPNCIEAVLFDQAALANALLSIRQNRRPTFSTTQAQKFWSPTRSSSGVWCVKLPSSPT